MRPILEENVQICLKACSLLFLSLVLVALFDGTIIIFNATSGDTEYSCSIRKVTSHLFAAFRII